MKKLLLISLLFISISTMAQRLAPRLDTLNGKVIFTDENGIKYDVFKSAGGKSCIIKDGIQIALFRREPKVKPETAKNN